MEKATIIGIDIAKRVFQIHAASKDGRPVLRKKVSRAQLLDFLAKQPPAKDLLHRRGHPHMTLVVEGQTGRCGAGVARLGDVASLPP